MKKDILLITLTSGILLGATSLNCGPLLEAVKKGDLESVETLLKKSNIEGVDKEKEKARNIIQKKLSAFNTLLDLCKKVLNPLYPAWKIKKEYKKKINEDFLKDNNADFGTEPDRKFLFLLMSLSDYYKKLKEDIKYNPKRYLLYGALAVPQQIGTMIGDEKRHRRDLARKYKTELEKNLKKYEKMSTLLQ